MRKGIFNLKFPLRSDDHATTFPSKSYVCIAKPNRKVPEQKDNQHSQLD